MIVVDASAILEVLLNSAAAGRIAERILDEDESLHVPHLIDLEVTQVLRRYVHSGDLTAERAAQSLEDLTDLPLIRYPHLPFLWVIWELRANLTAYDAAYVALASTLPAVLVTRDRRLKIAERVGVRVELV